MTPSFAQALSVPIATPRLVLEPLLGSHADELFGVLQDPRTHTWIPAPESRTVEALRERWTRSESRLSPDGREAWLAWAIRIGSNGTCIGRLDATVSELLWVTNLGYVVAADHWGRGYATEAVAAGVARLFGGGVRGCDAFVATGNVASRRVLTRLGFETVGSVDGEVKFTRAAPV